MLTQHPRVDRTASTTAAESRVGHERVRNVAGVQMLPRPIHRQMFGDRVLPPPRQEAIDISMQHLKAHGLAKTVSPEIPAPIFDLPSLHGKDIEEHFWNIGKDSAEPWLSAAKDFAAVSLPAMPMVWSVASGWTAYYEDGSFEAVLHPPEGALVFDVETLPAVTQFSVMAVAASKERWYSWLSPWLLEESEDPHQLVPMPSPHRRLIVGHNVGFDRARIKEEYELAGTQTRFIDTMSLHIAAYGLSNPQRPAYLGIQKMRTLRSQHSKNDPNNHFSNDVGLAGQTHWSDVASMNSLEEVARLHCNIKIDKSIRNAFLDWNKTEIAQNIPRLLEYCAMDVSTTHAVFQKLLPDYLKQCPHPVSFAGMLHMGTSFLPVDETWERFLDRADQTYNSKLVDVKESLWQLADSTRRLMFVESSESGRMVWEDDHWLKQLDWTSKKARWSSSTSADTEEPPSTSVSEKRVSQSDSSLQPDLRSPPALAPAWFVQLKNPRDGSLQLSHADPMAALVFKISYKSHPLVFTKSHGWLLSTLNPNDSTYTEVPKLQISASSFYLDADERLCWIPSTGPTRRMRTLIGKKNRRLFDQGLLQSPYDEAQLACQLGTNHEAGSVDVQTVYQRLKILIHAAKNTALDEAMQDPWLRQLDWTAVEDHAEILDEARASSSDSGTSTPDVFASRSKLNKRSSRTLKDVDVGQEDDLLNVLRSDVTSSQQRSRIKRKTAMSTSNTPKEDLIWPQWFWALTQGGREKFKLTSKSQLAPLLLRLTFANFPLYRSRQHGWVMRIPVDELDEPWSSREPLEFNGEKDPLLENDVDAVFFKIPHPAGDNENVGSPLAKSFDNAFETGVYQCAPLHLDRSNAALTVLPGGGSTETLLQHARAVLSMNLECSYWVNASQRIKQQMVVWRDEQPSMHSSPLERLDDSQKKQGMILPQVTVMGTVTRRATERTWLAAANAKESKIGTELKSMIRAPPGYAIVGADVDSEELWICSVMGDAQFGFHGATAIGWMTLEGSKSSGTDLHSKSAGILGISRNDAKVFNYSRLYGAGVTHAVQLLTKEDSTLAKEAAMTLAKQLYMATKGHKHFRGEYFSRKFWHGGTESYVFNKLEEIAMREDPRTPALGCGITRALQRRFLPSSDQGQDFMTSRVNWVVQSSGVDYLHLLIVAMSYLIEHFDISARFLISVHDEIRYLAKWDDRYRCALALQIANLWTRCLFAYKLEMDDLPQCCAWFSGVDIDYVLRKEVNLPCVTPSNPTAIPAGEVLDIVQVVEKTNGDVGPQTKEFEEHISSVVQQPAFQDSHRCEDVKWLEAQAAPDAKSLRNIWHAAQSESSRGKSSLSSRGMVSTRTAKSRRKPTRKPVSKVGARSTCEEESPWALLDNL